MSILLERFKAAEQIGRVYLNKKARLVQIYNEKHDLRNPSVIFQTQADVEAYEDAKRTFDEAYERLDKEAATLEKWMMVQDDYNNPNSLHSLLHGKPDERPITLRVDNHLIYVDDENFSLYISKQETDEEKANKSITKINPHEVREGLNLLETAREVIKTSFGTEIGHTELIQTAQLLAIARLTNEVESVARTIGNGQY